MVVQFAIMQYNTWKWKAALLLLCIILNANQRTKIGEA